MFVNVAHVHNAAHVHRGDVRTTYAARCADTTGAEDARGRSAPPMGLALRDLAIACFLLDAPLPDALIDATIDKSSEITLAELQTRPLPCDCGMAWLGSRSRTWRRRPLRDACRRHPIASLDRYAKRACRIQCIILRAPPDAIATRSAVLQPALSDCGQEPVDRAARETRSGPRDRASLTQSSRPAQQPRRACTRDERRLSPDVLPGME